MHFSWFYLGHIQKVVDKWKKRFGCIFYVKRVVHHRHKIRLGNTRRILPHWHFVHSHDGVYRCPYLVWHICQKSWFGGICPFRFIFCPFDFRILASDNSAFQHYPNDKSRCENYYYKNKQSYQRMFEKLGIFFYCKLFAHQFIFPCTVQYFDMQCISAVLKPCILKWLQITPQNFYSFWLFSLHIHLHNGI